MLSKWFSLEIIFVQRRNAVSQVCVYMCKRSKYQARHFNGSVTFFYIQIFQFPPHFSWKRWNSIPQLEWLQNVATLLLSASGGLYFPRWDCNWSFIIIPACFLPPCSAFCSGVQHLLQFSCHCCIDAAMFQRCAYFAAVSYCCCDAPISGDCTKIFTAVDGWFLTNVWDFSFFSFFSLYFFGKTKKLY